MKTLENNILLYDCDCPLCNLYSGAFIKTGMLDKNGRMPYHAMTDSVRNTIDVDRSRNEIALIDTAQNKVIYGLDSLVTILGNNFPLIRILFRFQPFYWFMKKVYAFISYNRKIIAPSKELNAPGACTPDYNLKYRWIFILLGSVFIAWILNLYFSNTPLLKNHPHGMFGEWLLTVGQLLIQGSLVYFNNKERVIDYLGHNIVISMIGSLLLLPAILFADLLLNISPYMYIGYFAIPVSIMLWQHIRRVKIMKLSFLLTITWGIYRAVIGIGFIIANQ